MSARNGDVLAVRWYAEIGRVLSTVGIALEVNTDVAALALTAATATQEARNAGDV